MAKKEKGLNNDKEAIAKSDNLHQSNNQLSIVPIEKRIYLVRDTQVMIDLDLASLYDVENRSLRQAVRRNLDSFPDDFMFRLSQNEANDLIARGVSQSVIPPGYNTGGAEMYAFTEQGVAMLATVLKSPKARAVSIDIMRAFVAMRHFLMSNAQVFQRLDRLEIRQLETEHKIEEREKVQMPLFLCSFGLAPILGSLFVCILVCIKRKSLKLNEFQRFLWR